MLSKGLVQLPANRAVVLDNITCPYCGIELNRENDTKEHVIGRRFVPKGMLHGSWNLIVRACEKCNSGKSQLENDISAITLAGRLWFGSNDSEENAKCEAQRKATNSISNKTGKPVINSQEELNFEVPLAPSATIKFNMVMPPQVDSNRLYNLARMQMMAFFYFITFNHQSKKGGFWPEGFHPLSEAHQGDWGNSLHKAFMNAVINWETKWAGFTADGYFKSIIRRHPNAECWAWAIEWNKNYRIIGFFGSRLPAQEIVDSFQSPEMTDIEIRESSYLRLRCEVKLPEEDDLLFKCTDENA